jgi:hypothetical protein
LVLRNQAKNEYHYKTGAINLTGDGEETKSKYSGRCFKANYSSEQVAIGYGPDRR